ncbi:hypothetical protein SSCG_05335 [Streptomyces clavuligerus]|nr:hypothetical protein SSCG_05335 [Streptomyces clavuligerus]
MIDRPGAKGEGTRAGWRRVGPSTCARPGCAVLWRPYRDGPGRVHGPVAAGGTGRLAGAGRPARAGW